MCKSDAAASHRSDPRCDAIVVTRADARPDRQCWAEATEYLVELLGARPDSLSWDADHHLQGHALADGHELVVIAARDTAHHAIVLSAADWDEIRRTTGDRRSEMLRSCAIDTHDRLEAALATG